MTTALIWDPALAGYRLPEYHPMKPERFTLAVALMREWGLLDPERAGSASVLRPQPATRADLGLFHTRRYVDAVIAASADPRLGDPAFGLGEGDTPAFAGMHDAAALAVGATCTAIDAVLSGRARRAFNPAGGLHHTMPDRASGFCVYNDSAIAIERATRSREGLRVAYVDIDAHHGDGVQRAFHERGDVLTLSVHESGRFLFPGTGDADDIGSGPGLGACLNVPLPAGAGAQCYELVLSEVIRPAVHRFAPDLLVLQLGADTHVGDPLTHLELTVRGYVDTVRGIARLADEVCDGRIVAVGGGGYQPYSVVPRMWASAMAVLMGIDIPEHVPETWMDAATLTAAAHGATLQAVTDTLDDRETDAEMAPGVVPGYWSAAGTSTIEATWRVIGELREVSPLLADAD